MRPPRPAPTPAPRPPLAAAAPRRFEELSAAHASWRSLLADPALSRGFLATPVAEVPGKHKFTPKQLEELAAAGLPTLRDVLECYPRGYTVAAAGALPDRHAPAGEEQAVCLVVDLADLEARGGAGASWASLSATLAAVHPGAAGLAAAAGAAPAEEYAARRVRLVYGIFRRGRYAKYAVAKDRGMMEQRGRRFVVSARVARADEARWGAGEAGAGRLRAGLHPLPPPAGSYWLAFFFLRR